MVNINFVPDDYVQSNESRRTNLLYLVLLAVVMAVLGGSFVTIKLRQRVFNAKEKLINNKITQIQQAISQFEELQTKRKEMMKAALTTAQLIEPIPKSILLASLTNNLPPGVSLLRLYLIQKEPKRNPASRESKVSSSEPTNKYQAAQHDKDQLNTSKEQSLETYMDITGTAPSDLQVAAYIERLSKSNLLQNVALVESKEYKIEEATFRQFKLTAMLRDNAHLTKEDVELIKAGREMAQRSFK
jgi:Tfp pilus assembly protein PilN